MCRGKRPEKPGKSFLRELRRVYFFEELKWKKKSCFNRRNHGMGGGLRLVTACRQKILVWNTSFKRTVLPFTKW